MVKSKKERVDCIEHLLGFMFCDCPKCKEKRKKRIDLYKNGN